MQDVGIEGILICQWGTPYIGSTGLEGPATWTPPLANSYRVSDDIARGWANVLRILNQAIYVNREGLSGPGHWSDMDMLEVGNPGMTIDEQASHFAVWALFKSTLMISTAVSTATNETLAILKNEGLLAINQDDLGLPVTLVQRFTDDHDLYSGKLANGDLAVLLLDSSNSTRLLSLEFADLGIESATVLNLWTEDLTTAATSYSKRVNPHGSLPLRLSNIARKPESQPTIVWLEAESGATHDGANVQSCSGCSGTQKVGNLGENNASLTLSGINATGETQDLVFDYINCEIGYLADQGLNARAAQISVNSGAAQTVQFPLTGKMRKDHFPSARRI